VCGTRKTTVRHIYTSNPIKKENPTVNCASQKESGLLAEISHLGVAGSGCALHCPLPVSRGVSVITLLYCEAFLPVSSHLYSWAWARVGSSVVVQL